MVRASIDITVRNTEPHERRAACDTMRAALLTGPISDDEWVKATSGWEEHTSMTAWEGANCVGHAGAFSWTTVVPGGAELPTAGVTRVGVLPTHTRMGLLTRMMRQLLTECRAEGAVLASLRASEATIYGRFGFGLAGDGVSVSIDPRRVRPISGTAPGSFRLLARNTVLDVLPELYHRVVRRPGTIIRSQFLWQRYFASLVDGSKAEFVVVHTAPDGTDDGFAHYSLEWVEKPFEDSSGKAQVFDLVGASPAVELALWDYLTGIDLLRVIVANERPVDDVLRRAAHDIRGYSIKELYDEQWLRLLDVEAALSARVHRSGTPVTIAVTDPMFTENTGTFRISADGVTRTDSTGGNVDLRVDVATLSAAYMGSTTWVDLCAAGRAVASDPEAAGRADDLFAHRPAAWCGSFF